MTITSYRALLFGLAALAYAFLLVLLLLSRRANPTRAALLTACAGTAASAAAIASGWSGMLGMPAGVAELASAGTWCFFVLHLVRKQLADNVSTTSLISGCGFIIVISVFGFAFFDSASASNGSLITTGQYVSRLGLSIYGILLTENLYRNSTTQARWHVKMLCIALGVIFGYGIMLYADALLFSRVGPIFWVGRAIAFIVAVPLFAVSIARNPDWEIDIHVSRAAVVHTTTLVGSGIFLLALALTGELLRSVGPGWGELAEIATMLAGITALAVVITSGSARSRLRWLITENFFTHRYDYRREWIRSSKILSTSPVHSSVQTRVINAIAEIADSHAGILCVRDLDGSAFQWAGSWNCPSIAVVEPSDGHFVGLFKNGNWIVELDKIESLPQWFGDLSEAWLAVPLAQQDEVIGFVVLARPRAPIKLDRETFDLLRIVARQAATHVAEQQYLQALAESQQLRDYGKRFAFVVHDMKNVAGQLRMILQNSKSHSDDPEFQKDVLATVEAALNRMEDLLGRLRPESPRQEEAVLPIEIIQQEVAALKRSRGCDIDVQHSGHAVAVAMDPTAFRSVIAHLCENAVEACGDNVQVRVNHGPLRVEIEVTDEGEGMTAEFIRDNLFQPFGSTKGDGFGIGAYQARELIRAAGGDLLVTSGPGCGTTMRILLPCVSGFSNRADLVSGAQVTCRQHNEPQRKIARR